MVTFDINHCRQICTQSPHHGIPVWGVTVITLHASHITHSFSPARIPCFHYDWVGSSSPHNLPRCCAPTTIRSYYLNGVPQPILPWLSMRKVSNHSDPSSPFESSILQRPEHYRTILHSSLGIFQSRSFLFKPTIPHSPSYNKLMSQPCQLVLHAPKIRTSLSRKLRLGVVGRACVRRPPGHTNGLGALLWNHMLGPRQTVRPCPRRGLKGNRFLQNLNYIIIITEEI